MAFPLRSKLSASQSGHRAPVAQHSDRRRWRVRWLRSEVLGEGARARYPRYDLRGEELHRALGPLERDVSELERAVEPGEADLALDSVDNFDALLGGPRDHASLFD